MNTSTLVILTAALVSYTVALTAAQTQGGIPTCASKLAPCFNSLNSTTTPPKDCCDPVKQVVKTERTCLCSIYNNPALIQAFNINVTQALSLITRCHVDGVKDPNICKAAAPSPSSSSPSTGSTPVPSGSGSSSSPRGNAAAKITGAAPAGLVSLLLIFGAYTMFN